jgi:hypothetical protein
VELARALKFLRERSTETKANKKDVRRGRFVLSSRAMRTLMSCKLLTEVVLPKKKG